MQGDCAHYGYALLLCELRHEVMLLTKAMPTGSTRYSCGPSPSYAASNVLAPHGLQHVT